MTERPNRPIKHNYFLSHGLASVIAIGKNGHRLEVGIIGREGNDWSARCHRLRSNMEGSSFFGLFTRVEIGHVVINSEG